MKMYRLTTFLLASCLIIHVTCYSSGPPLSACRSMVPGHFVSAQTSPPPYVILLNASSYMPGIVVEVTVNGSEAFRGLQLQMRQVCGGSDLAVGSFSLRRDEMGLQLLSCNNNSQSAVAHRMVLTEMQTTVYWTAPVDTEGHLFVQGTFVQFGPLFWTGVRSEQLNDQRINSTMCPNGGQRINPSLAPLTYLFVFANVILRYVLNTQRL